MTAVVDQILVGREDTVGQPVVADELPDILDRVQFGAFGWQWYKGDVGRNHKTPGQVPAGLIEQKNGMPTWSNLRGYLGQMQIHRLGVAGGQDKSGSFSLPGADGTEDIGRGGALVTWCRRPRTAPCPAPGDLVLLADAGFIGEPDLYLIEAEAFLAGNRVQTRWECFLKSSIAPSV